MILNGMDTSMLKSQNKQLIMPSESQILRKLVFSKIVDATVKKFSMAHTLRENLMRRATNCSKR
jgi:hypothetical protein